MRNKIWKRIMQFLALGIVLILAKFSYEGNKSQSMKFESTLKNQKLGICGEKPNCVSSFQDKNDEHYIKPTIIKGLKIEDIDSFFNNCKVNIQKENYRHYECTSKAFKFVDDIEILIVDNVLHYRSASRVGYSDLGVNRKRVNELIQFLNK